MQYAVGIDIGGTKISIGVIDRKGSLLAGKKFSTDISKGPESIVEQMAQSLEELLQEIHLPLEQIGIGMAGQVDSEKGIVNFAPNLGWKFYPLGKAFSERMRIPVYVTNDVRAAAWGEWKYGAGRGYQDIVCVFVGTGIGCGIIQQGKVLQGVTHCAGEVGHIIIDWKGPQCGCGNFGCFEALAGGRAIGRIAQERIAADPLKAKTLMHLAEGDAGLVNAKLVHRAVQIGDPLALEIWEEVQDALVAGLTSVVNLLNPRLLILGGGVVEGDAQLVAVLNQRIKERALPAAVTTLEIVGASLKSNAGVIGAAFYNLTDERA